MDTRFPKPDRTESSLSTLGGWCWVRAWLVLAGWAVITCASALIISAYSSALVSGAGSIAGSQSARIDAQLTDIFEVRDSQALILTYNDPALTTDDAARTQFVEELENQLREIEVVDRVIRASDLIEQPREDKGGALIITLDTKDALGAEQQVPIIRAAIGAMLKDRSAMEWAVSGRGAISYDLAIFSAQDSGSSELRALPLALLVLLYAFRALVSAALPVVLALAARAGGGGGHQ